MKAIMWMVGAIGLVLCTGTYAKAQAFANIPKTDHAEAAKANEAKGDLARGKQNYLEAAYNYRAALKIDPNNSVLHNKLGLAYLQSKDHGAARKEFRQAVKLDPRNVNAYNNLGALACLDRRYNSAVQFLKRALEINEASAPAHLNMAEAWVGLEQMDRAMTEYARALELDSDILSGSPDGVLAHVQTPEQRARVDFLIAEAYAKRGNLEGALEYLERAREEHFQNLHKVYDDVAFTPLWSDVRLAKIVKR